LERTAFATPCGLVPPDQNRSPQSTAAQEVGVPRVTQEGQGRDSLRQSAVLARTARAKMPDRPDRLFYRHAQRSRIEHLLRRAFLESSGHDERSLRYG
jgi:hypothetical protein